MRHQSTPVFVMLLALVVSMHAAASPPVRAAWNGRGAPPSLMPPPSPAVTPIAPGAPQDPTGIEAALNLDRSTRRLIQQGLKNEGFDPGTPDGLFGPRTRDAIREWQQSRDTSPTGYLNRAEVGLLQTAAASPAAPAVDANAVAPAAPPAPATEANSAPAPGVSEADSQNATPVHTESPSRPSSATRNGQLPPEVMVDRHLVRMERLLASDDFGAAFATMNKILALQEEHSLVLEDDFYFHYARVAFAAARTETAIASLNEYLVTTARAGEFYREALELLDAAEVRLEREAADRREAEAERRRAEAARRRVARWPPGHVFRDCETCPEMVVLPGSVVAMGRYEVTVGEYRTFAASTGGGAGRGCDDILIYGDDQLSWRNPGFQQTDRHPVTCLGWDDANAYVSWLSRTTEAAYRLPSLLELVDAAEGSQRGCHDRGLQNDAGTCPVGTNGTNKLGLSDVLGNVEEWTSSCQRGNCNTPLYHGGGWHSYSRLFGPGVGSTDYRTNADGFRVARALE